MIEKLFEQFLTEFAYTPIGALLILGSVVWMTIGKLLCKDSLSLWYIYFLGGLGLGLFFFGITIEELGFIASLLVFFISFVIGSIVMMILYFFRIIVISQIELKFSDKTYLRNCLLIGFDLLTHALFLVLIIGSVFIRA
jgi:hypothetical protein